MNALELRCIDISYRMKLTHVSSVLNTVNLIGRIYAERRDDEPFILGNSHAALALFVVLESVGLCNAEEMVAKYGTHASRDPEHGIWCSGGSLGQAETVAVGFALADLKRKVWLVTSDGSCMEGAVYEAMRVAKKHCPNLKVYVVFNGYGAYGPISHADLPSGVFTHVAGDKYPEWLRGLPGHYLTLTKAQHEELMR